MASSAPQIIARSGISARVETDPGAGGLFQLVFRRATLVSRLPCRGHHPQTDDPAALLQAAMRETAFFDECDDILEWAGELSLDPGAPDVLDEFRAFDTARSALIELIGQAGYDALQLELAMGQAISAAASGLNRKDD